MELFWTQITDARPARTKAQWDGACRCWRMRWGGRPPAGDGGAAGRQAVFSRARSCTFRQPYAHGGARGWPRRSARDVEQVRPLHPAMARWLAQADCGDLQPFEL